jgi:hypothetical protein
VKVRARSMHHIIAGRGGWSNSFESALAFLREDVRARLGKQARTWCQGPRGRERGLISSVPPCTHRLYITVTLTHLPP